LPFLDYSWLAEQVSVPDPCLNVTKRASDLLNMTHLRVAFEALVSKNAAVKSLEGASLP